MDKLRRLADKQSVIRSADLERLDLPRNYLGRLVREGKLQRVGRGLYSSEMKSVNLVAPINVGLWKSPSRHLTFGFLNTFLRPSKSVFVRIYQ